MIHGVTAHNQDYLDRAIADLDQVIQLRPDYAEAYFYRGLSYADKGDHAAAITDYSQAIQLNPHYADAYYNRGFVYMLLGSEESAMADFKAVLQLSDNPYLLRLAEDGLKALGAK